MGCFGRLLIVLAALAAACSSPPTEQGTHADSGESVDRADSYASLEAVAGDADLVVLAEATDEQVVDRYGQDEAPYTTTTLLVIAPPLQGETEDEIQVRQLGSERDEDVEVTSDRAPILEPGAEYLLFLTEQHDFGEYLVVGAGAGLYQFEGEDLLVKLDPSDASAELPDDVTLAEVEQAVD